MRLFIQRESGQSLKPHDRWHRRRHGRGVVNVSALLEAAAFMAWWTWIIVGQKHVADATAARRSVDYGATDQALVANASRCGESRELAPAQLSGYQPEVGVQTFSEGKLSIGNLISLLSAVAIGREPTFEIFLKPFSNTSTWARVGHVAAPPLLGGGGEDFQAHRRIACVEMTRDRAETSITDYRKSVFSLIQGY